MNALGWSAPLAAVFALLATSAAAQGPAVTGDVADLAFVDVNLVPMDSARVVPHQSVLVHDGAILVIGPADRIVVPSGARRVDGAGRAYLAPGLADMHVHVSDEDDLGVYVANGVTTVLHMGGTEQRLVGTVRRRIACGEIVGPQMLFSLMLDGDDRYPILQVRDAELARDAVRLAKANGYDFIKVYNDLTPDEFAALVDEGLRQGLPVIGHGVRSVGLPAALFQGQVMVAHAEEFLYTAFAKDRSPTAESAVVAEVQRSGAYVTPTLASFEAIAQQWGKPERVAAWLAAPRAGSMSLEARLAWRRSRYMRNAPEDMSADVGFLRTFTLDLQNAGVPLLAGTDSPEVPGMYPGFSLHDELRSLVRAGLTPYQALAAATRTPGAFVRRCHPDRPPFGIIEVGARGDLILLHDNPLASVDALDRPLGVALAGRWFDRRALDALLAAPARGERPLDRSGQNRR